MHKLLEPEAPVSLTGRRRPPSAGRQRLAIVYVVGERGTTCSATTGTLMDSTVCAQETFWRTTAEGAYQ